MINDEFSVHRPSFIIYRSSFIIKDMYIPKINEEHDQERIMDFIRKRTDKR